MFRQVHLPNDIAGKLFLHSMPGRRESWEEFEQYARAVHLDVIVCLTPMDEILHLSPYYANAIVNKLLPCYKLDYAYDEFANLADPKGFPKLVRIIVTQLKKGQDVLIHCAQGVGRTGLTATRVLQALELDYDEASERVLQAGSIPQQQEISREYTLAATPTVLESLRSKH